MGVCISMILFNIFYILFYSSKNGEGKKSDRHIQKRVYKLITLRARGHRVSLRDTGRITRMCQDMWNLAAWDRQLSAMSGEFGKEVEQYISECGEMFLWLTKKMKKKKPVQMAHFAYIVHKYKFYENEKCRKAILAFMSTLVQSENLYCRENALKVLYANGEMKEVYDAMQYLFEGHRFNHEKLLVDGLLTYSGNKKELMDALLKDRKEKKLFAQKVILNYIRFGSDEYKDLFLQILNNPEEDDECRYIALRYFGRYADKRAREILIQFAENPDEHPFEYAAIAATALGSYMDEETVEVLKDCLCHSNWYIRHNAAVSLEKFQLDASEFKDILYGSDKYAREVLEYRMQMQQFNQEQKGALACQ